MGDAAVLVDPHSAEAIADGILKVLHSSHLRADLREKGYARVREYSWMRSVGRVREVYGEETPDLIDRIKNANPRIVDSDRIMAGDILRFPRSAPGHE